MLTETAEMVLPGMPDRIIMFVPGLKPGPARNIAIAAVAECRRKMPKSTGQAASRLEPIYGPGFFGIRWLDSYTWFIDHGTKPFTMNSLAGKTIPMWISDPTGSERAKNPQAKVKTDASGKVKVLIFRRAAKKGQRKVVTRRNPVTGARETVSNKPMSYPGAPGRIGVREMGSPSTTVGRVAGAISRGNVGVRWRHPGIAPRSFLNNAITIACQRAGILPVRVYIGDDRWRSYVHGARVVD